MPRLIKQVNLTNEEDDVPVATVVEDEPADSVSDGI